MDNLKTLSDFFIDMRYITLDDAKSSINLWRDFDKKWYIAARIEDKCIVVSTTSSVNDVQKALLKIIDIVVKSIDSDRELE